MSWKAIGSILVSYHCCVTSNPNFSIVYKNKLYFSLLYLWICCGGSALSCRLDHWLLQLLLGFETVAARAWVLWQIAGRQEKKKAKPRSMLKGAQIWCSVITRVGVGGGRKAQEGGDIIYLWLIHVNIWQKPTQYCKAIILQLKEIFFFKEAHLKPLLTSYLLTFHWPKQVIQPSPIWMGKKVVQPTAGGFWVEESTGLYVKKITSRADRSSVV